MCIRSQLPVACDGLETARGVAPRIEGHDDDVRGAIGEPPLRDEHVVHEKRTDGFAMRVGEGHENPAAEQGLEAGLDPEAGLDLAELPA